MPFNLSRWFAVVALVSIAVISAVSGWLLSQFLVNRMLQQEARLTQQFIDSIVRVQRAAGHFSAGDTGPSPELKDFFVHVSDFPDVLRANLYSRDGTVLWSSDATRIGRQFRDNPELEQALRGSLVAHGGFAEKPEHSDLHPLHPYFFEIYAPVRAEPAGDVVGVVELYRTPRALFEAISAGRRAIWIGAALAGALLYAALFWMVRRADDVIRLQGERLVQSEKLSLAGEMSTAVAHGIRNPLSSIRSSAELALETGQEQWREAARDIIEQVDRLESWVRELLSYSQPLAGKLEPIDVAALLMESLQGFEREFERRGIEVSTTPGTRLLPVKADRLGLGQVFNSLIANAAQAIERNGRIAVSIAVEGNRRLRVSIADSGPGRSSAELLEAFKPFHTTKAKGSGVGLALSRRIVERYGGSIDLASSPGRGTTVHVLLPTAQRDQPS